jgi:tripartite-type tricarboxylate transporter receptor subunit TctC
MGNCTAAMRPELITASSGGGTIRTEQVRPAAPDGYTILYSGNTAMAVNVDLMKSLPYDPVKDVAPITRVTANPLVLVVWSDLPIKSESKLVPHARAPSGQMNYGVLNAGNNQQDKMRALAVTSPVRLPTIVEAGVPGYADIASFLGM